MKYVSTCISVDDINESRKFYEDLFGLDVYQDYGINITFSCGLALQQDFDWLTGLEKDSVLKKSNNMELYFEEEDFDGFIDKLKTYNDIEYVSDVIRHDWGQRVIRFYDPNGHIIEVGESMKMVVKRFLDSGMSMDEVSLKMDISATDLAKLLNS